MPALLDCLKSSIKSLPVPEDCNKGLAWAERHAEVHHKRKRQRIENPHPNSPPKAGQSQVQNQQGLDCAAIIETASGLAAVLALVENLGRFISPYVGKIIDLVLCPQVRFHCPALYDHVSNEFCPFDCGRCLCMLFRILFLFLVFWST